MPIFHIDIDDTLCHSIEDDYAHSVPCLQAIKKVNDLFDQGNTIILATGRGSWDNTDWRAFTEKQLAKWGVKYNKLIFKPNADVFIDDKALNARDWLHTEEPKEVTRVWGKEYWIVNCDEYCSKLLYLPKGAYSEYHYHRKKKETFYCLRGQILLTISGEELVFDQFTKPITVFPEMAHMFKGLSNSILLEISTHHSDEDVVFFTKAFNPNEKS